MTAPAHVIIVSYYFPPLGLAGTARPAMLANLLVNAGHRVSVVTVKPIKYDVYDPSLLSLLESRVEIRRVESLDPARMMNFVPLIPASWRKKLKSSVASTSKLFPDSKTGFVPFAVRGVEELIADPARTVLVTTSPPVSSHLAGIYLKRAGRVKWIADFRDVWTSLPADSESAETGRIAANLTREITGFADAVTSTSPQTADYLLGQLTGESKPVAFVPNGYDDSDFSGPAVRQPNTIGLYGTLNHLIGFDKIARFVAQLRRTTDIDWRIRHIGHVALPELPAILSSHNLTAAFESTGYLPRQRSIGIIRRSTLNLIALSDQYDTRYIVPSKLFELLRAEAPLLALLPRYNAARRILTDSEFPGVYIVDGAGQFVEAVEDITKLPLEPVLRPGVERYEWKQALAPFVSLINGLST